MLRLEALVDIVEHHLQERVKHRRLDLLCPGFMMHVCQHAQRPANVTGREPGANDCKAVMVRFLAREPMADTVNALKILRRRLRIAGHKA